MRGYRSDHTILMPKKCPTCGILLDISCTNPACSGHYNESIGDVCVYCVTNERENTLSLWLHSTPFRSSLGDIGHGED
jgi:hypothetical protein